MFKKNLEETRTIRRHEINNKLEEQPRDEDWGGGGGEGNICKVYM